jgi:hypothetical protein
MLDTALTSRSYFRRAMLDQHNVILMLGALLLALAFASPIPLLAGFGAEALWLAIIPRLPAFRRWVDRYDIQESKQRMQQALNAEVGKLGAPYRAQFEPMSAAVDEVITEAGIRRALSFDEMESARVELEQVLRAALQLLKIQQAVVNAIADIPLELTEEAARLERALAGQRDLEARMGLRQALLATQKRLAQRAELQQSRSKIEAELKTVETGLGYLARTVNSTGAERLVAEASALALEVARVAKREAAVEDVLGGSAAASARPELTH